MLIVNLLLKNKNGRNYHYQNIEQKTLIFGTVKIYRITLDPDKSSELIVGLVEGIMDDPLQMVVIRVN